MKKNVFFALFLLLVVPIFSFMVQPLSQTLEVEPGEQLTIELILSSTAPTQEVINVTASGLYSSSTDDEWISDDNYNRSCAKWLTLPDQITLSSGQSIVLQIDVEVPVNTVGSYFAGLNFKSAVSSDIGQIAYKFSYLSVLQIVVKGRGNRDNLTLPSATTTVIMNENFFEGMRVEFEAFNPSDWLSGVWGKIDIKSDEQKRILSSLNIEKENAEVVFPKKNKMFQYDIQRLIPPGEYTLQLIMDYGYKEYYKGKITKEFNFMISDDVEKNRENLFVRLEKNQIFESMDLRETSRGLYTDPKYVNFRAFNYDYVDITIEPEIQDIFTPKGFNGERYTRNIDSEYVQIRPDKDILSRAFYPSGDQIRLFIDYRKADLSKYKGEYYGYLDLSYFGELDSKIIKNQEKIPIILNFGNNEFELKHNLLNTKIINNKITGNFNLENLGNSRIEVILEQLDYDIDEQKILETKEIYNDSIYPDCVISINLNSEFDESVDSIIYNIEYITYDEEGKSLSQKDTYEVEIKRDD
ncbi:MAG: hypothetical protein ACQESN_07405 [Thermotogota bacterium]